MNKTPKQLERYFKGVANHKRISILQFVYTNEGVSVYQIAATLNGNLKTISQHTLALVRAGLLNKKYIGARVSHSLSPYGKAFLKFIKTF
jgi:predicted transcriptional regulator